MPHDLAPCMPTVRWGDEVVVFVHGIFASAGVFRPMRRALSLNSKLKFASFTHAPGVGVKRIAGRLAELLDELPSGVRVHIIGHSLGGIVARWYVQELGGHARATQTISLASPFGGAALAAAFPFSVGADLREGSSLLEAIRRGATRVTVPHTSIAGENDRVVFPPAKAHLGTGDVVVMPGRGHNELLFDHEVAKIVGRKLRTYHCKRGPFGVHERE